MVRTELAQLLRLAFPIILTQLSQMGMGVADTVMAGRYGAVDLAGVALGGGVFWPLIMLCAGVLMAITPSVSQLHGGGEQARAGEVIRQAGWIALGAALLVIVALRSAERLFGFIEVDPSAIPVAVDYLDAIAWGVPPLLGYFALRYLCEGMSWTLPAMVIAFTGLLLKLPLNYLFMHGFTLGPLTVEAMGGAGCGWASALIMWVEFVVLAAIVARSRMRVTGLFARFSVPDPREIGRLVRLGLPIGLTTFLEISLFSVVSLLIGRLGVEALAAHQIAMNVGGLAFMIPMALGIAVSIRVGFNVGAKDLAGARRSGRVAIGVSFAFAAVAAVLLLGAREWVAGLYTTDSAVLVLAAELMVFVALWQFVDDTQVTAIGALRGFKDTRVPLLIALLAYWIIGLPVGVVLGFGYVEIEAFGGVRGFWVGFCAGLFVAAVVLVARFAWLSGRDDRILAFAQR
ncbi:MAG: MATE family efflux transporter [Pseudomonadales bacterium]|nr:MATE family efflux transporter [Pseudomonadales bacterium]